jgi:hypothetical protein
VSVCAIAAADLISIKNNPAHSINRNASRAGRRRNSRLSRRNDVAAAQAALTWRLPLSVLMVRCPKTGREFNSGYRTNGGDLAGVPPAYTISIRCPLCNETHAVRLAQAREAPENSR